jgi:hypothetical protein
MPTGYQELLVALLLTSIEILKHGSDQKGERADLKEQHQEPRPARGTGNGTSALLGDHPQVHHDQLVGIASRRAHKIVSDLDAGELLWSGWQRGRA